MRAKEFIVEYKRDITLKNFRDQLIDRLVYDRTANAGTLYDYVYRNEEITGSEQIINNMIEQYMTMIERADPTNNKQYTIWILRRYLDGTIKLFEDISSVVAEFLMIYHTLKVKKLLPAEISDINQIKTKQQFDVVFRKIDAINDEFGDKPELDKGTAKEIFKNSEVRVIQPLDEEASCYYGQGTRWCTAATKSDNLFDSYHDRGNLFIFIPTKADYPGEKYQLHVDQHDYELSLMDKNDDEYDPDDFKARFPSLKDKIFEIEPNLKMLVAFNREKAEQIRGKVKELVEYYFKRYLDELMDEDDEDRDQITTEMEDALEYIDNYDLDRYSIPELPSNIGYGLYNRLDLMGSAVYDEILENEKKLLRE